MGSCSITIRNLLSLASGTILALGKQEGDPMEFKANGKTVAKGKIVSINEKYGIRITGIVNLDEGV